MGFLGQEIKASLPEHSSCSVKEISLPTDKNLGFTEHQMTHNKSTHSTEIKHLLQFPLNVLQLTGKKQFLKKNNYSPITVQLK